MEKTEKIINEFERFVQEYDRNVGCTSYDSEVLEGVLALLKAREPRVMTLEEVNAAPYVWVEDRKGHLLEPVLIMQAKQADGKVNVSITTVYGSAILDTETYNVQWRCWTSRPDEKRRAETPWD